jgi:hypothetical protein
LVDGIYVINKSSNIPIFTNSFSNESDTQSDLLGGLMSAIISFGEHLQIGQITNFDSTDHRVVITNSDKNILAIAYNPLEHNIQDPHSLAGYLLEIFESKFPEVKNEELPTELNTDDFTGILTKTMQLNEFPFYYKTLNWAQKEFGGELYTRQDQFTSDNDQAIIDIVLDRGTREQKGLLDRITDKIVGEDFSKDIVYIKVIDGQAGRGEIEEFFNLCSTFGRRRKKENKPSYFPSIAVVVARSYSPTVPRIFDKLSKKGESHILTPKAAPDIAKRMNRPPKSHQCSIQCWKWEGQYPDLIYE